MNKKKIYMKIGLDYAITIFGILFIIFIFPKIITFFLPFVIGYIISIIANPIVKFLEKNVKIVRKHSTAIIIGMVIFGVFFFIYWIFSIIIGQAVDMVNDMPDTIIAIKDQIIEMEDKFYTIYEKLPEYAKNYCRKIKSEFNNPDVLGGYNLSLDTASTAVKSVAEFMLGIIFTILSAYFFTADRDKMSDFMDKYVPKTIEEKLIMIYKYFTTAVGGYFKGQFKIMIILISIMFLTFEFLDINYSFLISLGIGFLDFLPIFGTGAVLWPWAAYELIIGDYSKAIAFCVLYIVCQLVKQFLQPKVVGDSIGISPMTTLVLLFFGYKIGGLIGILIALPIGLVIINLYRAGTFDVLVADMKYLISDISAFCKNNRVPVEKDGKNEECDENDNI